MRILHVILTVNPAYGGPVEGILRGAEALEQLGHSREIASLDPLDAPYLAEFPLPVYPMGPRRAPPNWMLHSIPWLRYGLSLKLIRWLRKHREQYDVVVVNGVWNFTSVGTWLALRHSSTPYFVFTHGMLDPWFAEAYPLKHQVKRLFWTLFEHRVLRDSKAVLFTTEDEKKLAERAFSPFPDSGVVVGYGTGDAPPPAPSEVDFPGRYLIFLSRIHRKKGCDDLIRAFAQIAASEPELRLVIAGPDQTGWVSELKRLAEQLEVGERILWPGMLTGAAKWNALRGAEAFVLPTHSENFGIVIAEAMSCGTPVLTTNKANIWREVGSSGGGFISDDNPAAFARVLRQFLALSTSEKQQMRRRARAGFLKHFWIKKTVLKLISVLSGEAEEHHERPVTH